MSITDGAERDGGGYEGALAAACPGCTSTSATAAPAFTFAFQPVVDVERRTAVSYEALVRGADGGSAAEILASVDRDGTYRFDQDCRVRALEGATRLGLGAGAGVSINFLPNAVYRPEVCIRTTLAAAARLAFPISAITFEVAESERVVDRAHLTSILRAYQRLGFSTAIDDFGAGFAGLGLLADFQPDFVKIDMDLIRDIDARRPRQEIVRGVIAMCRGLDVRVVAEGVETDAEYRWLRDAGITLFQGYLFARPGFETLPPIAWPA